MGMRYDISKHNEERKVRIPQSQIAVLYTSGKTLSEIAQQFGVSVEPIKRILRESGVAMRKAAPRRGIAAGQNNPSWKGGKRIRRDGYVLVWTPNGDYLEHRLVMERHIGRKLTESEIVHHKDGNPSNNQLENLELLCGQSEHALKHGEHNRRFLLQNGLKQCTICFLVKPVSAFYKTKHNKMGIQSWCKNCKNQKDSERRKGRS